MKVGPVTPMPWDMVVFLVITTVGFGFSVQKVMNRSVLATPSVVAEDSAGEERGLASLTPTALKTVDLGCVERRLSGEHIASQEGTIRIKGKICHLDRAQMKRFDGMSVKNLSNGYEGTVFFQGFDTSFVSDYLALQQGKNVIQLEWRESKTAPPRVLITEVFEK